MKNEYAASHARDALKTKSIKRLKMPFLRFCSAARVSDIRWEERRKHALTGVDFRRHLDFGFGFETVKS